MKYKIGQRVILLDTEFKPAGDAVVKDYNGENQKYFIGYKFLPDSLAEEFWVPQERLLELKDAADKQNEF